MLMFTILAPPTVIALLVYLLAWVIAGLRPSLITRAPGPASRGGSGFTDVGMPKSYEQTGFITEMKDELNRVAGQYVRRKTGKDKLNE